MAFKACRSLTLILLLSLSVVTLTATVHVPTVIAATGGDGTYGDPDSPKDTGPKPVQTQVAPATISAGMSSVYSARPVTDTQVVRWLVVQQLLSTLLGRPGLLR